MNVAESTPVLTDTLRDRRGGVAIASDGPTLPDPTRQLAANDVFHTGARWPDFAFRLGSVAQLTDGVADITGACLGLAPRGGGMSNTAGCLPARPLVTVDLCRLNRVLEVNTADSHVTVQAGCTWAQVREPLAGSGLITPYGGRLSGLRATVAVRCRRTACSSAPGSTARQPNRCSACR